MNAPQERSEPIEEYGLIGDTQTAALVSRRGSLDWLCLPRFDSGACFAALLGTPEHGRWLLAPEAPVGIRRRYRPRTLVLETEYETDAAAVRVIDFMPTRGRAPDVIRIVEGLAGSATMRLELRPRFDYGSIVPWIRRAGGRAIALAGPDGLALDAPVEFSLVEGAVQATFTVREGERLPFSLSWFAAHEAPPERPDDATALAETERWWRDWCGRCSYDGPWRGAVERSLIVLKALTFEPTGGILAAPTTSLPEKLGGVRNWDYRYCWVRDATFTLYALLRSGFDGEARAWRDWLLRAVAGDPADFQIMYGPAGERRLPESELPWLPGYERSRPVRIGNAAAQQLQLDVYGELMDALHLARRAPIPPDADAWSLQRVLLSHLEGLWRAPDEGIWEMRGPRRQFTHSKVMAWVAFDRAAKAVRQFGLEGPAERWRDTAAAIHREVCREGFDGELGSFVQEYGGKRLDASLLMIPLVGFLPADDPRVVGTIEAVKRRLTDGGFTARYEMDRGSESVDGLPPGEAAFLPCTLWLADTLALSGKTDEAAEIFQGVLAVRNDLGLLAEEYDAERGRLLGNFPQAFSHVGLVNTARNLAPRGPAEERGRAEQRVSSELGCA